MWFGRVLVCACLELFVLKISLPPWSQPLAMLWRKRRAQIEHCVVWVQKNPMCCDELFFFLLPCASGVRRDKFLSGVSQSSV